MDFETNGTIPTPERPTTSRAVKRTIEAGANAMCWTCDEQVKFKAKVKMSQVICNVYVDGNWDRVEHYHEECYETAGEPYGPAVPGQRKLHKDLVAVAINPQVEQQDPIVQ